MRRFLFVASSILWVFTGTLALAQQSGVENRIQDTKTQIEAQIEKIREAREKAENEMVLAKIRVGEQLRKSEEELKRQLEVLDRFRDKLADEKNETNQAIVAVQRDWGDLVQKACSDIEAQIDTTNSLISDLQGVRKQMDVEGLSPNIPNQAENTTKTCSGATESQAVFLVVPPAAEGQPPQLVPT
jgi:chromosome segregation ATPase